MCDNRTDEFFQLVQSLPASLSAQPASITSQGIGASNISNPNTLATSTATGRYGGGTSPNKQHPQANTELRSFHLTAADISKDIAATSIMLSQLTQLVKEKSLFVDDSSNVNGLVMRIKGNIESLNGRLDEANTVISTQKRRLGKNSQAGQEASNVVGQLKEEFVQATTGFKKVLQARTDSLKDKSDQKRQVYGAEGTEERNQMSGGAGADPSLVSLENKPAVYNQTETSSRNLSSTTTSAGNHAAISSFPTIDLTSQFMSPGESTASSSQLPRPHGARENDFLSPGVRMRRTNNDPMQNYSGSASSYYGNNAIPDGGGGGGTGGALSVGQKPMTPLDIQRMEQASGQEQMMQLIPDQDYLRERADAMSTVETNIVELGTIFNKLAVMVGEHKEMVQRVEDNVDDANTTLMLSMDTLTDTLANLRTNKTLFLKVFSILAIFIVFFIFFFA